MVEDIIDKVVAEVYEPSLGVNALFQKVQDRLKEEDVEVTKQKVKAAKLVLPYTFQKKDGCTVSDKKIQFINEKIQERQNHKRFRNFKDAEYLTRGLEKMGVVFNDRDKTWSFCEPPEEAKSNHVIVRALIEKETEVDGNIRCRMCGHLFKSRNLVFKHLRDPSSDCGNVIFANGEKLPIAPSVHKKVEKKKKVSNVIRPRARTGKTAQHANNSSSLWIGDLPLEWTRMGGKYKRFRALLRQYLPNDVPQPWVKTVVRKAYRKRSSQQKAIEENEQLKKDEYLGYAIVVFRCDEEADQIRIHMDDVEVNPAKVFQTFVMNDDQLSQLPSFRLKIKAVLNSDSSMIPEIAKCGVDPPLREQLRPLTISELEKRINHMKNKLDRQNLIPGLISLPNHDDKNSESLTKAQHHEAMLNEAVGLFDAIGPRKEVKSEGRLVPECISKPLLEILESLCWQVPNERRHLTAERYLVLPTNITNDRFYGDLRDACKRLMQWADDSYFYSGIAVTKNFISSPHIDDRDKSYQYAISLGDFDGGELCVEGFTYNEESKSFEEYINVVNTRNRIARVEGRHIHWVRSFKGGDRYSLIFYDTTDNSHKPILESGVCSTYLNNN